MKPLLFAALVITSHFGFAFETKVVFKNELSFTAASLDSISRQNETFSDKTKDPELESLILSTVNETIKWIPAQYLPALLTISVEQNVLFTKIGKSAEQIPLSMILTFQIPAKNEIRYSDFEMRGHPEAVRTIIAHETGHMLMEWACRAAGVKRPTEAWVGSIYEGVADYISATVNNTTIIGTPGAWYSRDILRFATLDEAHKGSVSTIRLVEQGWTQAGLIPRYQTYNDMMVELKKEAPDNTTGDSYVEAPWLAGQLWKLNGVYDSKLVFDSILKIAMSGKKFTNPELFLSDVKGMLQKIPKIH